MHQNEHLPDHLHTNTQLCSSRGGKEQGEVETNQIHMPVLWIACNEGPEQCLYCLCATEIQPVTAIGQSPALLNK